MPSPVALRRLSRENAFYFFTSIGNYTGKKAASLEEFLEKVLEIDEKSLVFHLHRGDFEKWVAEVLEELGLAKEIERLKNLKPVGSALRDQLYLIVLKRLQELKR